MNLSRYLLKEYGSWAVLFFGFIAGLVTSRDNISLNISTLLIFSGLCLLINSKQALVTAWRLRDKNSYYIFLVQIILGTIILFTSLGLEVLRLYPFVLIPLVYTASVFLLGEHALFTEIAGFFVLGLSSLVSYFSLTHEVNIKIYLVVTIFFTSGVFKVRVQLKKGLKERLWNIFYLVACVIIFLSLRLNPLILAPLVENLIFSITLYRVRLKITGWIEVLKGILFLVLLYLLWNDKVSLL